MLDYIKNNVVACLSLLMFIVSFQGAMTLFSYANNHGLSFYDFMQPQLITAAGVMHLLMILSSSIFIVYFLFITYTLSDYVFIKNTKQIFYDKKPIIIKLILILLLSLSLLITLNNDSDFLISCATTLLTTPFYLSITKKRILKEEAKSAAIWLAFAFLSQLTLLLTAYIFIQINVIEDSFIIKVFLVSIYILTMIYNIARKNNDATNEEKKTNYIVYGFILLILVFIVPLTSKGSDRVINKIGVGFQEKCFYTIDLENYHIPDDAKIDRYDGISSVFVLSDISKKMSLGSPHKDKTHLLFSFEYTQLNEVACN
ncbi:hypothetical protein [Providencia hangzhouensis]|uniref:hypothetical protein n=1 Tax=Providencia hangzhouensis TaxID=3031799 RepID=UPI0034DD3080